MFFEELAFRSLCGEFYEEFVVLALEELVVALELALLVVLSGELELDF